MSSGKTIKIDDVEYVRKDEISQKAESVDGMECVIVRTYSAGVFMGYLEKREGQEVILRKARMLWKWDGATTLSQIAEDGVSKPENCMFPQETQRILLLNAISIYSVTEKAKKSIDGVKVWKK